MSANLFGNFLTVGSLPLIVLLLIIYYSKDQFKTIKNVLFKIIMFLVIAYAATEILFAFQVNYQVAEIWIEISTKIHYSITIIIWLIFIYYIIALFDNVDSLSFIEMVKYNKITIVSTALFCIGTLAVLFIPAISVVDELQDINKIEYFPMKGVYIPSIFVVVYVLIILVYYAYFKRGKHKVDAIISISIIAMVLVFFILQGIFTYVSFSPILYTMLLYLLYFMIENPDLEIIKEINNSQEDIEKSNQAKTDFLSNMSYEIKMPMNLIISLCDELNNMPEFDEKEVKDNIKQIVDSGNKLLDIINNILDISKIETGKETLSEIDYNINDIINNVINVSKQKLGAKPVKLMINIDQSTSAVLHGDSSKIYQSLLNVVLNAIKFTEVGRITITLSSTRSNGYEHLLFKVSDTGIGIKPEDRDKVFVKGQKIENELGNEEEGAGLGLVITKQYIDSLDGKIWFESEYRVGTTFFIEIAQKIIDATPLGSAVANTTNSDEKLDCSAFKVLIVDDNVLNIKVAKRLLEKYKFQVESVTSGKECVDLVKNEVKYDGIFMDHMMPEMDGIETLHVLKKLDGYVLPPVIALTANAIAGMKEMYLKEGFDDYLSKPINTHELDRVVNKFFKKK